jgi:hypothetical protein
MLGALNFDPLLVVQGFVDSRCGSSSSTFLVVVHTFYYSDQPTLSNQPAAEAVDAAAALSFESVGSVLGVLK